MPTEKKSFLTHWAECLRQDAAPRSLQHQEIGTLI